MIGSFLVVATAGGAISIYAKWSLDNPRDAVAGALMFVWGLAACAVHWGLWS